MADTAVDRPLTRGLPKPACPADWATSTAQRLHRPSIAPPGACIFSAQPQAGNASGDSPADLDILQRGCGSD